MFKKELLIVNNDLKRTRKAIIGIGCSFVEGQGAVNDELYEKFKWTVDELGLPVKPKLTAEDKEYILKTYPRVGVFQDELDFTFMEQDNAFTSVLCKKYFEGQYTPINLGLRGHGNRASIKELYFQPIRWDLIDEIIVLYCPSGMERFDFAKDAWTDHFHWTCMWPNPTDQPEGTARRILWDGYNKSLFSEKFAVLEQVAQAQELLTWCKLKNAKLIITPGFDLRYNKENFKKELSKKIIRKIGSEEFDREEKLMADELYEANRIAEMFPWQNMFFPEGQATFVDLVMKYEKPSEKTFFYEYFQKGSPNKWITPCSHPAAKGHDVFAKALYKHITSGNL